MALQSSRNAEYFPTRVGVQPHYFRMITDLLSTIRFTTPRGPNALHLIPVQIPVQLTVERLGYRANPAGGGLFRMGIYNDNAGVPDGGTLIVESGNVGLGFANQKYEATIVDTVLLPGLYWLAWNTNTSHDVFTTVAAENLGGTLQGRYVDQAFGAFPNPCPVTTIDQFIVAQYLIVKSVP